MLPRPCCKRARTAGKRSEDDGDDELLGFLLVIGLNCLAFISRPLEAADSAISAQALRGKVPKQA